MEFFAWLQSGTFATWVAESHSLLAYPTFLLLHTVGLAVVVGANAVLDLRVLGVGRRVPLALLEGVFRPMWIGFAVNAVSGAVLFAAAAEFTGKKPIFYVKLGLILLALVTAVRLRRSVFGELRAADLANPDAPIPRVAKILAVTSLILWAGAIAAGRYTAYM